MSSGADAPSILEIQTRLRMLNTLLDPELVDQERRDLAAERDADVVDEPR